ncbi:MAG: aspartate--tRNA ligase [Clostridia bacterium]|nr:aspartate--tRNA ligase [Clostridia bacterium]
MSEYRTHTCNELRAEDAGKEVKLSGFVKTIRDLGGCVFIDLRDHYGITQLTTEDPKLLEQIKGINVESSITVEGTVVERPEENINDKIATGKVEVEIKNITVQNNVMLPLPFEVEKSHEVKEDLRLQYRFLDLRNESIHEKIVFRSKVLKTLRDKMDSMGFVEVQTPILTSSSPEGARDYLIPSRIHPGEFYALPQAPQQFKQLLMISGFDKYYQIAPCFRDEDPRADRSPGEFYQLDFEMAFATQEEVLAVLVEIMKHVYGTLGRAKISEDSFQKIPYRTAMDMYGSDKPDLRNPLILTDVTDCFAASGFNAFKNKTVKAIAVDSSSVTRRFFDEMTEFAKTDLGMAGLAWIKINEDGTVVGPIAKYLTEEVLKDMFEKTGAKENYGIFFIADQYNKACKDAGNVRNELGRRLGLIDNDVYKFCFIVDFPFYEETDDGKIDFGHNPFSMPQGGLEALENENPLDILAYQYDMVCNGYEIVSGAVRNHDTQVMTKAFEIAGYSEETVKNKFGALYNAFKFGAPPHAGAAPGIDRMIMLLLGETNIREVIAFPKNSKARDLLMQAPNYVTEEQLRDVHIKIDVKDKKKED